MFGDSKALIQLDMSEYMEKSQCFAYGWFASRLCGLRRRRPADRAGPPQAILGGALRRNRKSASGRDEHAAADSGRRKLTDNVGRVVNFRNTIIPADLERRRGNDQEAKLGMGFSPITDEEQLREDAGEDHGGSKERLPSGILEPSR